MTELYLGLMSGTSMDGVDAALCEFADGHFQRVVATQSRHYEPALRRSLLDLQRNRKPITLDRLARLDHDVALTFARTAQALLRRQQLDPAQLTAIGSHGQTVFHDPAEARSSTQLGDPSLIAALTGVTTVADFRRADIAHRGQGAPLVPAFHHALFASSDEPRCVVNVGGIANVTILHGPNPDDVRGFDTGPGNGLMDEWIFKKRKRRFDANGSWAGRGAAEPSMLRALLADGWFRRKPPKSTGRDYFNLSWALRRYRALTGLRAENVQRTLLEVTARSVADAIRTQAPGTRRILVCGGGSANAALMQRLAELLAPAPVESTAAHGLDPRHVEAAAFAWLAMRTMKGLPGNVPAVTGAKRAAVLGGIFRA